jgi:hypothetical protein
MSTAQDTGQVNALLAGSLADVASLRHVFAPESVVVIGASRRREAIGRVILENIRGGYAGRLYTVHPRAGRSTVTGAWRPRSTSPSRPTWRSSPCRPRPCLAWPSSAASAACGRSW